MLGLTRHHYEYFALDLDLDLGQGYGSLDCQLLHSRLRRKMRKLESELGKVTRVWCLVKKIGEAREACSCQYIVNMSKRPHCADDASNGYVRAITSPSIVSSDWQGSWPQRGN